MLLQGTGKWYELQDLHVKEIEPQMLTLTESYIQVGKVLAFLSRCFLIEYVIY